MSYSVRISPNIANARYVYHRLSKISNKYISRCYGKFESSAQHNLRINDTKCPHYKVAHSV